MLFAILEFPAVREKVIENQTAVRNQRGAGIIAMDWGKGPDISRF